ncbi:hypothetical protein Droror1_Dr00020221 [Drosera rotundifolia]
MSLGAKLGVANEETHRTKPTTKDGESRRHKRYDKRWKRSSVSYWRRERIGQKWANPVAAGLYFVCA